MPGLLGGRGRLPLGKADPRAEQRHDKPGLLAIEFHVAVAREPSQHLVRGDRTTGAGQAAQGLLLGRVTRAPDFVEDIVVHHAVERAGELLIRGAALAAVLVEVLAELVAHLLHEVRMAVCLAEGALHAAIRVAVREVEDGLAYQLLGGGLVKVRDGARG